MNYNPNRAPDPAAWLEMDEDERINAVLDFHRRRKIELPHELSHATFHVVVESQVAMGDELPVRATLERLMKEGLSRHQAIHAVASVLAAHLFNLMQDKEAVSGDPNQAYLNAVEELTAQSWLESASQS